MRSVVSVCLCVCLCCSCSNFWKLDLETSFLAYLSRVHISESRSRSQKQRKRHNSSTKYGHSRVTRIRLKGNLILTYVHGDVFCRIYRQSDSGIYTTRSRTLPWRLYGTVTVTNFTTKSPYTALAPSPKSLQNLSKMSAILKP